MRGFRIAYLVGAILLVNSCGGEAVEVDEKEQESNYNDAIEFDEKLITKAVLSRINASTEEADVVIKRAHLNDDEFLDAYISINLARRAQKDMEKASNPASFDNLGYLGNYNYLVVWDGETKILGDPYQVVSNGLERLGLKEQNLLDPGYKTLSATYRVRNSVFEIFFRYVNGNIAPVFSYKVVDFIGTNEPFARYRKIVENPQQLEKDIVVYEATIRGYSVEKASANRNYFAIDSLEPKPMPLNRFFFDKQLGKYATEKIE